MTKYDILIKQNGKVIAQSEYKYIYTDYFWFHDCLNRKIREMVDIYECKTIKFTREPTYKDHFIGKINDIIVEVIEK